MIQKNKDTDITGSQTKDTEDELPAFLEDDGTVYEIPTFITKATNRDIYRQRPGETIDESISRQAADMRKTGQ